MARIVLNTFGSLGDLNPYLAMSIGLSQRGHNAVVATSELYRQKVEAEGIEFAPVRPDVGELLHQPELIEKLWHPKSGSEFLIREYLLPKLDESYEDLLSACSGADLLLTHTAGYAAPVAAEALKIPWISVALQPLVFFSVYDPPIVPGAEWLRHVYRFGPRAVRALMRVAEIRLKTWAEPIAKLRERKRLHRATANPLVSGQFSRFGTLALFSGKFAAPQPDWPPNSVQTGFVFYDQQGRFQGSTQDNSPVEAELEQFLKAGAPPVLFTLGSSAVTNPGTFFEESIAAAKAVKTRAILLTGSLARTELPRSEPEGIFITSYLRFSKIMPRTAAIVHQGGIGTTAQALKAGRPMLVVPWAHDQPDNAARLVRLGVARTVPRARYRAQAVARELSQFISDSRYQSSAAEIGQNIAREDGITTAINAVESFLDSTRFAH